MTCPRQFVVTLGMLAVVAEAQPDPLGRLADPVVLSGDQTVAFRSVQTGDIVGFRVQGGTWVQIPVQVDERFVVDYAQVYGNVSDYGRGFEALAYADTGTFTGADPDASLDADDEIVFMAADAGGARDGVSAPLGVDPASAVEVALIDPIGGESAHVYLFTRTGSLDPSSGADYVRYQFQLQSGEYMATYDTRKGPNPEDTIVETDVYSRHFSDRWISDEMRIGGGMDLLDRLHIFYGEGRGGSPNCARTEDTFSGAEGALVTNKDGPVRAIRTYVGANSGPLTERTHLFYSRREDIITTLRVHSIPGIHDVVDYEAGVAGLRYTNNLLSGFLDSDGVPDATVPEGQPVWEAVTSDDGSVVYTLSIDTNLPQFQSGFYRKDDASGVACTGDQRPIGMSGVFAAPLLCTDPTLSVEECQLGYQLVGRRTLWFATETLGGPAIGEIVARASEPIEVIVTYDSGTVRSEEGAEELVQLGPPRPHPFVVSSGIWVHLSRPMHLHARLYDALGRAVQEVYSGPAAGTLQLTVDGDELAVGSYLLRVDAGGETYTTSLIRTR